jgi:hypothetical protein
LLNEIEQERNAQGKNKPWIVSKHTNRIKGQTGGHLITRMENDERELSRNIAELLNDKRRNPFGVTINNAKWCVVLGEEGNIRMEDVNTNDDDDLYPLTGDVMPGQVYMYMPLANGSYMPIQIESVFLPELLDSSKGWRQLNSTIKKNKLLSNIDEKVKILSDPQSSEEAKLEAIKQIGEYLLFSKNNALYFNATGNKYSASYGENNIYVTVAGQSRKLVDFNEVSKSDKDEIRKTIWNAIM